MIRLATLSDVPQIASGLFDLVATTGWSLFRVKPTEKVLHGFLISKLTDPDSLLQVWVDGYNNVTGFCGGALGQFYVPPHMQTVYEWGWYGHPRVCARLWQSLVEWGKDRGATLAGRARIEPDSTNRRIHEHIIWTKIGDI